MTDKKPVLSVENLTVKLPDHADRLNAIEEVSFDVRTNEILCVVGESGSGKSVTAHTVMGLLPPKQLKPTAGRILLQDENLFEKSELELREMRGAKMSMKRATIQCAGLYEGSARWRRHRRAGRLPTWPHR